MSLPDVTLSLGSARPILLLGRGFTAREARELAKELEAVAELVEKRATRDLEKRVGVER